MSDKIPEAQHMSKIQDILRGYRLVYQPTSPLLKAVVTATIALCTVTLIALRLTQWEHQSELELLQQQAAAIELENAELTERINALGTVDSYRQIAAEQLGLVDPETIVIESE